jgi:hypothetical protein
MTKLRLLESARRSLSPLDTSRPRTIPHPYFPRIVELGPLRSQNAKGCESAETEEGGDDELLDDVALR